MLEALGCDGVGWRLDRDAELPPEEDTLGVIRWLHDGDLIDRVRSASAAAPGQVDGVDNPVSTGSYGAAVAAAGLAVRSALDVVNDRVGRVFLAIRPAGHHAERNRAMGFCFFNNVALAAEVLARAWQARVMVVDVDVHHGNGTQHLFYDREDVGYLSVHRYPFFPGTGAGDEGGTGRGRGATLNIPLAAGADDAVYAGALESGLEQLGSRLRPAAVLVSAGFDAHIDDPLGGMRVTEAGFRRMTRAVVQAAETWSSGRVLSVLEGGYDLAALSASVQTHVMGLCPEAGEVASEDGGYVF